LIFQVMNGENRFGISPRRIEVITSFQKKRNETGLPIMTMNDIRVKFHVTDSFHYCKAEKNKPFRVIAIAVKSFSSKIKLVINQIINSSFKLRFQQPAILIAPAKRHGEMSD